MMNPVTVQMLGAQRHTELLKEAEKLHRIAQAKGARRAGTPADHKPLLPLFVSSFIILFTGMGLFPHLPIYAAEYGATPAMVGLYLGAIYTAIAAGTLLTGWLAGRLPPRGLFIAGGALGVPALALLGQAATFWQVVALTSAVWFSGGVGLALVSVFTGRLATRDSRGKSFSWMFLATPLGALIGGAAVSRLIAWQGYSLMFIVLSVIWSALPAIGLFALKDGLDPRPAAAQPAVATGQPLGRSFSRLLLISLLSATAISANRLGVSLAMQTQGFSSQAIGSTAAVSGLVAIPLTLLIGLLADRVERRRFLRLGSALVAGATLVLSAASSLWQFWLAATLVLVAMGINSAIASAFATELLAPGALNRGLSWLNTTNWVASILSFAASGILVDRLGTQALNLVTATLPVAAFILLGALTGAGRAVPAVQDCPQLEHLPAPQPCP